MREILFRGKRIDDGKWFEGDLLRIKSYLDDSEHSLIFTDSVEYPRNEFDGANEVIPETVGQYTGLNDMNGKRIFEGDIVRGKDNLEKALEVYGHISHENGSFVIVGEFMTHYRWLDYEVEVIGNIHDNPELLQTDSD